MKRLGYLLTLLILLAPAQGARVLKTSAAREEITVSHEKDHRWEMAEQVCVYRKSKEIACGEVTSTTTKTATVKVQKRNHRVGKKTIRDSRSANYVELVFHKEVVKKGDSVEKAPDTAPSLTASSTSLVPRLVPPPPPAMPASLAAQKFIQSMVKIGRESNSEKMTVVDGFGDDVDDGDDDDIDGERSPASTERYSEKEADLHLTNRLHDPDHDLAIHHNSNQNISFGLSYIFPTLQYQVALSNSFAIGLSPIYLNAPLANGTLKGPGGFFTLNYYGIEPFHGTFIQLGLGGYSLTGAMAGLESTFTTPAANLTIGWRWMWRPGLNFGFGLGAQYLVTKQPEGMDLDYSGVFPTVALDLGYAF